MDDEKPFNYGKHRSGISKKRSRFQFDDAKRRMRNSSYEHDSSTPKTIETVYRILCPVKKVGSVLGKGGDIINALRNETRAKITVVDAIPGAEERVIIIFNYSSEQPGSFDTDQNPEDANLSENEYEDMRPHCPAQNALLMVHNRIAADEYIRGGVVHERTELDDVVTARILVPYNQVGCLLGKGGTIIKSLRSETGADIRVLPAEHLPPCAMDNDELVQLSGMSDVVKKALYEVSTRLHQHPRKENPTLEELIYASTQGLYQSGPPMPLLPRGIPMWSHQHLGAYATPPMPRFGEQRDESAGYGRGGFSNNLRSDSETAEEFSMRILCPTGKIGGVIGKGGVHVRELEKQTGAKIQVENTAPEAEERIILVTCKEAPWDPISPTIQAVLQLQSRTSASSESGTITTRLLVPSSKIGCILGQGGNIITEIRRRTRAGIRVYPKDDKPQYTSDNEELVQISGDPSVATEALLEIASRLRTRTHRAGNAVVNPSFPGSARGFAPSGAMHDRGRPPHDMLGAGKPVDYGHQKVARPRHEAQGYSGPPTATGYNAGPRQEAQGYSGPPTATGYGAEPRHEAHNHPGAPTATGYNAGPRHEAQGYPCPPNSTGYSTGPRHEAQAYSAPPASTGYSVGSRHEGQGYPNPPTSEYSAGFGHEAQGYLGPSTSGGYNAGPRHEPQGYSGPTAPTGYNAGPRYDVQNFGGPPISNGHVAGPRHEAQGYPGPPTVAGYPNINSSMEFRIPNSVVPSVLGTSGNNISDIRQISGAVVKLRDPTSGASECVVEIHGSSDQMNAAQSFLQAFVASDGQNAPSHVSSQVPHSY